MITSSALIGVDIAIRMRKRVVHLRVVERIICNIEGEIYYRQSPLKEACMCTALRCTFPFDDWLNNIAEELDRKEKNDFADIWINSMNYLYEKTMLCEADIKELVILGNALGHINYRTKESGLALEKENIHNRILGLEKEINNKSRVAVIIGLLSGVLIVMLLM